MGKAARQSATERMRAEKQRQEALDRRKRQAWITGGILAVVAVLVIGVAYAQSRRDESSTFDGALAPIATQADGSAVMAKGGVNKPVLDVYEDFQCPACKLLEEKSSGVMKELAAQGKVKVVYHPLTIFPVQAQPMNANSVRAGAAARCVSDGAQWMKYHDKLFANQPDETVQGFKIPELVTWGQEVGISDPNFPKCVESQQYAASYQQTTEQLKSSQQLEGTPTLKLDGKTLGDEAYTPDGLRKAILGAST